MGLCVGLKDPPRCTEVIATISTADGATEESKLLTYKRPPSRNPFQQTPVEITVEKGVDVVRQQQVCGGVREVTVERATSETLYLSWAHCFSTLQKKRAQEYQLPIKAQ